MKQVIIGEIQDISKIDSNTEYIKGIISFLGNETNFKTDGVFEVGDVKAIIMTIKSDQPISDLGKLEVHKNYHDLHVTLEGSDNIAFLQADEFNWSELDFNEKDDYGFIKSDALKFKLVQPLEFCFIPVEIPHMALYGGHTVRRKIVFKVPC